MKLRFGTFRLALAAAIVGTALLTLNANGQRAQVPDIRMATIDGKMWTLSDLRGKVVVLNFWASWCLACRDEHSTLSSVAEAYAGKGVKFYGVLYNDVPANGTRWISEMGGQSYPSLNDPRTRTAIDYGLYGVPETFFIARDGRVAYKHVGPVTAQVLAYKLDSLLAQPAPGGAPRRAPGDSAKSVTVPTSGS